MKRIYTLAIAFIIIAIAIQSCKKDDTEITNKQESITNKTMMRTGDNTEAKVLSFIEKMDIVRQDPNYNGSEEWNYSSDSAVWYIEAALNYKYAGEWRYKGPEEHSDIFSIDSSNTQLNQNSIGGLFNIVNIQISYDYFSTQLLNQIENIEAEVKYFVVADIINGGISNSTLDLKTMSIVGLRIDAMPINGWYWGFDMGKCDGTQMPNDATDVFEWLNSLTAVSSSPAGFSSYYTDVNIEQIEPPNVPLPNSSNPFGFLDYELFVGADNTCMNSNMLNYYYNYFSTFDTRFTPSGYNHIFDDIDWGVVLGKAGTGYHYVKLYYGNIHYTSNFIDDTE